MTWNYTKQQFGTVNEGECSLLRLPWNKSADTISVVIPTKVAKTTKRGTLQKLAKIYDLLGLMSPIMLEGKLIYCAICLKKIGWDTELDEAINKTDTLGNKSTELCNDKVITCKTQRNRFYRTSCIWRCKW